MREFYIHSEYDYTINEVKRMYKIIVDAFGGDNSPIANIEGSVDAINKIKDLYIILMGDENIIKEELNKHKYDKSRLEVIHAPSVISCDENPTFATFHKKDSSLMMSLDKLKNDPEVSGLVSLSSTGALLVGGVIKIGKIKGVLRPACCPLLPTMNHEIVAVCDSGANVDCSKEELLQFAVMGSTYLKTAYNIESPRVALLNIGVEEIKGDNLRKETYPLLKESNLINFVGNMESRDLLSGKYDLVVADGFAGNVLIKATEGTSIELLKLLKKTFMSSFKNKLGAALLKSDIYKIKDFMDPNNYAGALLLGLNKIVIKGHGSSNARSVYESIKQAYYLAKNNFIEKLSNDISEIVS